MLWADQGTFESSGIGTAMANVYGELMAIRLTVRIDCTYAGGAGFLPLVSDIHRAIISLFGRQNHAEFVHVKVHEED